MTAPDSEVRASDAPTAAMIFAAGLGTRMGVLTATWRSR